MTINIPIIKMVQFDRAVPIGSKILVTGVNGLVGSHVADQLLQHGYLVRGSVRAVSKSSFLNDKFASKYGENKVELVQVENMIVDGAFDGAVRGQRIHTDECQVNIVQALQELFTLRRYLIKDPASWSLRLLERM